MSDQKILRLAMWSGPRNISTAMMRSWGNRDDTAVCDEPLYAHYLAHTGKDHPGAAEVIEKGETDWRKVVAGLTGPAPAGRPIFFQKQMTHHLLPHLDRSWLGQVTNAFLIRRPSEVVASFLKIVPNPTLEDVGFVQQAEIFNWVRERGGTTPPVIDAADVLANPRRVLGLLCDAVGVPFQERMLSWPPGPRDTDGVWAKYWYHEVESTTCFKPYRPKNEPIPDRWRALVDQCQAYYDPMSAQRLH